MKQETPFSGLLRISVLPSEHKIPPFYFQTVKNETKYIIDFPLIKTLTEALSFKFKLLEPEDGRYGSLLDNGSWTGIIGMLQRQEADIGIAKLSITERRLTAVNFTYPYNYFPITFVTDKLSISTHSYALLYPFSPQTWFAVALSLLLVQCLLHSFQIFNGPTGNASLKVFGSLLENSGNFKLRTLCTKLLMLFWIIGAMLLANCYKAKLLASLTLPVSTGIRTIEQLSKAAEKSSFRCAAQSHTYSIELQSGIKAWKKISECLIRSSIYTADIESFLRSSLYKKAFIDSKHNLKTLERNYFISEDSFFTDFYGIATRKSFCCKEELDRAILRLAAVGILDKFNKDELFFISLTKHNKGSVEQTPIKKLSLEDLAAAFIILLFGNIVAAIVLIVEISFKCAMRTKRK